MTKRRAPDVEGRLDGERSASAPLALVPQPAAAGAADEARRPTLATTGRPAGRPISTEVLPVPSPGDVSAVLASAAAAAARGVAGAMATVLERHGSAPGTPGQKLFVAEDGACVGTVGGGAVERAVLEALVAIVTSPAAKHDVRTFKLGAELGMCCGGRLVVLLEPIAGLVPSLVVGAGHVATAVAPLLARVGFAVTVVDARDAWGEGGRIAGVRSIAGEFDEVGVEVDPRGVCLVMTHDHALDQRAIEWALRRGFAYVGGVGSRAKAERTRQRLEAKGFSEADRARVRMPIGVDVGARTPDEIAVAIAAELIAWRKAR
ncbi:MAG: XdhC family protein [Labilithrix sp.]|nr:XdhC family protein [Labilithrix sp.]MBX3224187.1 XdhC family protein [Labilithrix sp.]